MKVVRITRESGIPLIGCIAFGIIDRGTDLIQVRPTSACNLRCKFCSTNANNPEKHPANYEVELSYLIDYAHEVISFKGVPVEVNLDAVGEVLCYPHLIELIRGIRKLPNVKKISMQTNGTMIHDVLEFEKAGLDQINLSINSLDPGKAQELSGMPHYDINKILAIAKMISDSSMQLLLAPVWIPNINDDDIPKLVELAKKLKAKIGIQKYEVYQHSRKIRGAKQVTFFKFYRQLKELEKEHGIRLLCTAEDFGVKKAARLPTKYEKGDKDSVEIKAEGWMKGQALAVGRNRCLTINHCKPEIGKRVRVKITDNKNNIYMAEKVR